MAKLSYIPEGGKAAFRRVGWVFVCGLVGSMAATVVWAGEWVTDRVLESVQRSSPITQAVVPFVGLVITFLVLKYIGRGISPSTADEYVQSAHGGPLRKRKAPARALATVATVGSGNALALEGPAVYFGAVIGDACSRVSPRMIPRLRRDLAVAGAAAGVSIIIGSPIAGAAFVLEVPYRRGFEHHRFLPAMAGAVSGYLTLVSFTDVVPFFKVGPSPVLDAGLFAAALVLGILAAVLARVYVAVVGWAKSLTDLRPGMRVSVAGITIAAVAVAGYLVDDGGLTLGAGKSTINWARFQEAGFWPIIVIIVLRLVATPAAVAGGGAGGVFVPLIVLGALLGAAGGEAFPGLFGPWAVAAGAAAVLGAGYRVPLSAATWIVAVEGSGGGLVLGLLTLVVAEGIMGAASVTPYQRPFLPGASSPSPGESP